VRRIFTVGLLALVACSPSGPPTESTAAGETRNVPVAVRYDQHGTAGDLAPPAEDLLNPVAADARAVQQGATLFGTMNCDGCHGGGGLGFTGPSLVDGRWRYGGDDGALFHSIFYGRPNGMPAYGGLLSDATVWQLITYIQSQPLPNVVPTVAWPSPELAGNTP
jgi:mono/diheme cytochrome c family protein